MADRLLSQPDCTPAPSATPAPADELPALFAQAVDHHRAGQIAEATALYHRMLACNPDLPEVYNNLGVALANLGRLAEAEATYRRAVALKRDFAGAYANLANTLRELGRLDEAEAACRAAIALDPNHWEAHANLGNVVKCLGRPGDAEPILRRAVALNPSNPDAHSSLGTVLHDLGRDGEAEVMFRRAIALRPDFAGAYNNLGLTLKESGRFDEAREACEQAIRLAPRTPAFYGNLAELRRFAAGDFFVDALEAMAKDPASLSVEDRIHLHFALAKAYEDIGERENAFRQLLAGNALKRSRVAYDEAAMLGGMRRVQQTFTPELVASLAGLGETSRVPVFVVGMLRSGTTLIEQVLASHPAVHGAGELRLFDQAAAAIRNMIPGSPGYPEMIWNMGAEHIRALGTLYLRELTRHAPGAARVTDKMPSNFMFAGLIHLALPNATVIHAVRDPCDTCISCFSKLFTTGQLHTYDLAELGRYYGHYQALMAHWRRVLPPGRILDVRYEDMVADIEGEARRIVAHCGLDWDSRCLAFHQTKRPVRTASATQVRRPIYGSSVGRWRALEPFLAPLLAELSGLP